LDVYFAESKLHNDFARSLREAFVSLESFHATPMRKHEYLLATHNLQLLDQAAQQELMDFFTQKPGKLIRTNHACLLGFDWDEYKCLDDDRRAAFLKEFEIRYLEEAKKVRDKVDSKLSSCCLTKFGFEFFMVPFKSVEDFRVWFNAALTG